MPPSQSFIFYSRHPDVCTAIIIIIIIIIIIMVVGALDSVSKKLAGHLEQLGIKNRHISSERCWKSEVSG